MKSRRKVSKESESSGEAPRYRHDRTHLHVAAEAGLGVALYRDSAAVFGAIVSGVSDVFSVERGNFHWTRRG